MLTVKEFKETRAIQIFDAQMSPSIQSKASTPSPSSHSSSPVHQQFATSSHEEARDDVSQPGDKGVESNVQLLPLLSLKMSEHTHAGGDLAIIASLAGCASEPATPSTTLSQPLAADAAHWEYNVLDSALLVALGAPRHVMEVTPPQPSLKGVTALHEASKTDKLKIVAGEVAGAVSAFLSSSLSHPSDDELIAILAGCASRSAAFAVPEPTSKAEHKV